MEKDISGFVLRSNSKLFSCQNFHLLVYKQFIYNQKNIYSFIEQIFVEPSLHILGSMLGAREKIVQLDTVPIFMDHVVFW